MSKINTSDCPVKPGVGHNSRHADPGVATDFELAGPLFLRQANVAANDLARFHEAIRSQGNDDVRHRALDNALVRHRCNPEISAFTYRVISAIAYISHGKYRYHCMPMEALAFFAGQNDGSHLHRALKEMTAEGAAVILPVPRKSGGRPMNFIALCCTAEDRTGAATAALYAQAEERYNGAMRAKRDGHCWTDLVENPIRQHGGMEEQSIESNTPDWRSEQKAIRHDGVYQSANLATRVHNMELNKEEIEEGGDPGSNDQSNSHGSLTGDNGAGVETEIEGAVSQAWVLPSEQTTPPSSIYTRRPDVAEAFHRLINGGSSQQGCRSRR